MPSSQIERKLAEYYINFRKKQYSNTFGKKMPVKKQKEIKDFFLKHLKDKGKYLGLINENSEKKYTIFNNCYNYNIVYSIWK